jgi:flagellar biosynthesis protein FliQ
MRDLQAQNTKTPVLRRAAAGLVLIAVAALVVHFIVGLVVAVFWIAVAIAAVVAVLWAVNTLA